MDIADLLDVRRDRLTVDVDRLGEDVVAVEALAGPFAIDEDDDGFPCRRLVVDPLRTDAGTVDVGVRFEDDFDIVR